MNGRSEILISVAVLAEHNYKLLDGCLTCIKNQTLSANKYEIILIDTILQSEESKSLLAPNKSSENCLHITLDNDNIFSALHIAIDKSNAPIIVLIDDSICVPPTWCDAFIQAFHHYHGAGVIGARIDPIWPAKIPNWLTPQFFKLLGLSNIPVDGVSPVNDPKMLASNNIGFKKEIINKYGGFSKNDVLEIISPTTASLFEDFATVKSNGYDILYTPHIKVGKIISQQQLNVERIYRNQFFNGAAAIAAKCKKENEIAKEYFVTKLDKGFTEKLNTELNSGKPEGLDELINSFWFEGERMALQLLELDSKLPPLIKKAGPPVIYVTTPCFNAVDTIDQTITSVISQAGDFIIRYHIQDGGSTDGTIEKLEQWHRLLNKNQFPISCNNIVFSHTSERDNGMYDALMKSFDSIPIPDDALMTWINSDDFFLPFAFYHASNVQKNLKNKLNWFGGKPAVLDENLQSLLLPERVLPSEVIKHGLCDGLHWDHVQQEGTFFACALWRQALAHGVFKGLKFAGDWNLWRVFAQHTSYFQLQWPLAVFRKHRGQLSAHIIEYKAELGKIEPFEKRKQALIDLNAQQELLVSLIKFDPGLNKFVVIEEDRKDILEQQLIKVFGNSLQNKN